jgi:8-oxo-dGTP diphosphatase
MVADFVYCPVCRNRLRDVDEGDHIRKECPSCGFIHYRNPAPTTGVIVLKEGKVLLVKRRYQPYRGKWVIPSGFVEYSEDIIETAVRELKEETGVDVKIDSLYEVKSCFDDPRGNTVLVLYLGHIDGGELIAGDDAESVGFFSLHDLPEIAFKAHRDVLARLREEF